MPRKIGLFAYETDVKSGQFISDPADFTAVPDGQRGITSIFDLDTEYQVPPIDILAWEHASDDPLDWVFQDADGELTVNSTFHGVTTQIKAAHFGTGRIFTHPNQVDYLKKKRRKCRHIPIRSDFHIVDYLRAEGHDIELVRDENAHEKGPDQLPPYNIVLMAHFLIVDLFKIVEGDFYNDLSDRVFDKKIRQQRRLMFKNKNETHMPWVMTIDGKAYRVRLHLVDTIGLHGQASLAAMAKNVGVELPHKNELDTGDGIRWIENMRDAYWQIPERFDRYALGDLCINEILLAHNRMNQLMYETYKIGHMFDPHKCTRLTIGANQARLDMSIKCAIFGENPLDFKSDDALEEFLLDKTMPGASREYFRMREVEKALLGKPMGGRCYAAKPTSFGGPGTWVDLDIEGAYPTGMATFNFPFGDVEDGPERGVRPMTLRKWWKHHGQRVVDGLYLLRIDAKGLKYPQNYFASYFDFKRDHVWDDEGFKVISAYDFKSGKSAYVTDEIEKGSFTSPDMQWLNEICSKEVRDDFLDNAYVVSWSLYSKADRCADVEEWREKKALKSKRDQARKWWFTSPVGDITDVFRAQRKMYPKKTPENNWLKLCANTAYGIAVSRHFINSNAVVAANITAIVRGMCWRMEQAFSGEQSITDGTCGDINHWYHPPMQQRDKSKCAPAPVQHFARMYTMTDREMDRKRAGSFGPPNGIPIDIKLVDGDLVLTEGDLKVVGQKAVEGWLAETALAHMRKVFPDCSMLNGVHRALKPEIGPDGKITGERRYVDQVGLFTLETKPISKYLSTHGGANYMAELTKPMKTPDKQDVPYLAAMRSYQAKKSHRAVTIENGKLVWLEYYSPTSVIIDHLRKQCDFPDGAFEYIISMVILGSIRANPDAVVLPPPFVKDFIVKVGYLADRYNSEVLDKDGQPMMRHETLLVGPGETSLKCGKPKLFSMSQFRFRTVDQYRQWKRAADKLNKETAGGFEVFFMNDDGETVAYRRMITEIDQAIRDGVTAPLTHFDPKGRKRERYLAGRGGVYKRTIELLKVRIARRIGDPKADSCDSEWDPTYVDPQAELSLADEQ